MDPDPVKPDPKEVTGPSQTAFSICLRNRAFLLMAGLVMSHMLLIVATLGQCLYQSHYTYREGKIPDVPVSKLCPDIHKDTNTAVTLYVNMILALLVPPSPAP